MVEVVRSIVNIYNSIKGIFPEGYSSALDALVLGIIIVIVATFIWKFYKSLSKRNLFVLDLKKYNTSEHHGTKKFFAVVFYFLEYILLTPFIIMLWFGALALVLVLISDQAAIGKILVIASSMVIAIRILAYHGQEISKDVAKMFPFIALSLFLLSPHLFDFGKVLGQLNELPSLFPEVFSFIVVIYFVEIFFRLLFTFKAVSIGDGEELNEDDDD